MVNKVHTSTLIKKAFIKLNHSKFEVRKGTTEVLVLSKEGESFKLYLDFLYKLSEELPKGIFAHKSNTRDNIALAINSHARALAQTMSRADFQANKPAFIKSLRQQVDSELAGLGFETVAIVFS